MPAAEPPAGAHLTYSQQYRRCGKADCPACGPGKPGHGPYWYVYWRQDGRLHSRYLGRRAPGDDPLTDEDALPAAAGDGAPHPSRAAAIGPPPGSAPGALW